MPTTEELLKENCKKLIEEKLGWGNSKDWTNRDFDLLSDEIAKATGVILSQTTLKRIWGKVRYDSAPTTTTLDTLARFLGFAHWRDFRLQQASNPVSAVLKEEIPETRNLTVPGKNKKSVWFAMSAIALTVVCIASWNFFSSKPVAEKKITPTGSYRFSSKKMVSSGVPNSVVFEYDASASPTDSIFIQQSWDSRLRARVSKNQHQHTSIYYYPGFFNAKLLVGNQVVKEHDLFIQTDGWLSLVEQEPVPVYFRKTEGTENGKLALSVAKMKSQNIEMKPVAPYVFYANIREFGDLKSDNFILETSLKNDFPEGAGACQKSEIRLLCEGSMISIPLSARGCISENNLFCLGHYIKGNENDLSGFGVNFNHFVHLRLEVSRGQAKFLVDGRMAYQISGITIGTKIKGIVYRFQGTGSVDWIKLSQTDGRVVYQDEF